MSYYGNIVGMHPVGGNDPCCKMYEEFEPETQYCPTCSAEILPNEQSFQVDGMDVCETCHDEILKYNQQNNL